MGAKRSTNQTDAAGAATTKTEWLWGYASGIAVSLLPNRAALVLADFTQTFDGNDVTYALPLLHRAMHTLGFAPPNLTADAAFDAWYIYQWSAELGGLAAIALNLRGNPLTILGPHDRPLCACNAQEMLPRETWIDDSHREQRFQCSACGTIRKMIVEVGHRMRLRLDRQAQPYRSLYKQRTAQAIARRNTLISILINLRALERFHAASLNSSLSSRAA